MLAQNHCLSLVQTIRSYSAACVLLVSTPGWHGLGIQGRCMGDHIAELLLRVIDELYLLC